MASDCICAGPLILVIGLWLIYSGAQRYLLYQKINNTPTSKVRSAAVGLVELFGKAVCREQIESPVSKARCVFWKIKGEYYQPGKNGGWRTIYTKDIHTQFYLEDDTGSMLVEPTGAEIDIPADFTSTGHMSEGGVLGMFKSKLLDPKVFAFLESDPAAKSAFTSRSGYELRLTESFIAEADSLYVLGSALPRDGASSSVGYENMMIKNKGDGVMYISDSHEKKAAEKVRNSVWLWLALGFVVGAIGLFVLLDTLGV